MAQHATQHASVTPDPQEIQRAEQMWADFIKLSKTAIIITVVILIILGMLYVPW
ncbi:MAG: hypothetical protein L6Q57_08785 [Alphaproteobacteria bacterium]|nr:hypothetical protein [Alphaproteobacteria bacterium]